MYIYFVSEFISNRCTQVYASVKYLIISNIFLKGYYDYLKLVESFSIKNIFLSIYRIYV